MAVYPTSTSDRTEPPERLEPLHLCQEGYDGQTPCAHLVEPKGVREGLVVDKELCVALHDIDGGSDCRWVVWPTEGCPLYKPEEQ